MNIHLFSLTEDAFFLALEDAHKRKLNIQGQQKLADSKKVKFYTYKTPEEYVAKQKQYSTPKQYRSTIRTEKKLTKLMKKQEYQNPNNRTKEEKASAFKNRVEGIRSQAKDLINKGGLGAAYDPKNRTVAINKNAMNRNLITGQHTTKLERHKLLSHELEHKAQFDHIKNKYGNSGANQAVAKGSVAAALVSKNPDYTYTHNPLEKKAYEVGAKTNSLRDRKFGKNSNDSYNKLSHSMLNPHLYHKAQKSSGTSQDTIVKNFTDKNHYAQYKQRVEAAAKAATNNKSK